MSVIGRLDEQVDDVLIKPLSRRRGADEPDAEREAPAHPPTPDPAEKPSESESTPERGELPVWLL